MCAMYVIGLKRPVILETYHAGFKVDTVSTPLLLLLHLSLTKSYPVISAYAKPEVIKPPCYAFP